MGCLPSTLAGEAACGNVVGVAAQLASTPINERDVVRSPRRPDGALPVGEAGNSPTGLAPAARLSQMESPLR